MTVPVPPQAGPPPLPPAPAGPGPGAAPIRADGGRVPSVFFTLYRLFLRTQITKARVISLVGLAIVGVLVGWALGAAGLRNPLMRGTDFVNLYGLSLLVPIVVLVFASSMFGDLRDDSTLVYLWLRPVGRLKLAGAAALASLTVSWPLAVPPLVLGAALTGGGPTLVQGTFLAATVVTVGYTGLFLALGLRVKRPLVWGLLYIFIWEGFIARGSFTAAKAAVRAYGSSVLSAITNRELILADISLGWSIAVPLAAGVVGLAYTVLRLHRQDVA
jgi:ABC-2 type transport system permease protein